MELIQVCQFIIHKLKKPTVSENVFAVWFAGSINKNSSD